ncbi:MAG: GntR family transcriptional regulator/MocR family aminotransferase [Pseudohongiellaceae bacterium]|jgi:GntR family transcriptional regulator/MocR family aminotransferase
MEMPSFYSIQFTDHTSLQTQLQSQLRTWICEGRLQPGTKLPSSRRLSSELGISRNTITIAIEQLRSEGFLETFQGKGVYVVESLPTNVNGIKNNDWKYKVAKPELSNFAQEIAAKPFTEHGPSLPFTPGIPDLEAFPSKIWNTLQRRHHSRSSLMGYNGNQGYQPLREALAEYLRLSRGVRCKENQIIITHGAQQAISLCAQILINNEDEVLVENPGYMGAKKAFKARGARLRPCLLGENGLEINALVSRSNKGASHKLMYCTPTHQYPLGGILPASDRLRLLDWAAQNNTWIIEDDYDSEFHFHHKPVAALQGMAEHTPVIYMGSFSKTLFPALRLGYLVVPEELVDIFITAKNSMSGESPLLPQAVIADFIVEGHFTRHLRKMRLIYQEKWLHLHQLLCDKLKDKVSPIAKSAGMHLAIKIPNCDDKNLADALKKEGLGSSPLSAYYLNTPSMSGLVLGFANSNAQQREKLVSTLDRLITSTGL